MLRRYQKIYGPTIGRDVEILAYGHDGAPFIVFPTGGGRFHDFEDNGMIDAVASWLEEGAARIYAVDGIDHESWLNPGLSATQRALRHNDYQDFILTNLTPYIRSESHTLGVKIAVAGCSLGAFHAANFALKFPETFNYALCLSGRYDIEAICGRSDFIEVYYNNPVAYTSLLHSDALERIRRNTFLTLVCGQGAWEDTCLSETHRLADILLGKGIGHERDIWGHDVEHHWYWWHKQIAYHFGKRLG